MNIKLVLLASLVFVISVFSFYEFNNVSSLTDNYLKTNEMTSDMTTTTTQTTIENNVSTSTDTDMIVENNNNFNLISFSSTSTNTPMNNQKSVQAKSSTSPQLSTTATQPAIKETVINTSSLKVMAWVYPSAPGCNAAAEFSDGRHINTLKPEFFTINNGSLELFDSSNAECNGYSAPFVNKLKNYSDEQYVTVSSASTDIMDVFFSDMKNIDSDINTLVSFIVSNNLTGIELDFEDFGGWSETSYANYKEFVRKLGSELHAKNKKLMLDGPAIADSNEQTWYLWRYEDFINLPVDTIVIMLYDYQFDHGAGQPIAPLDWMKIVINRTVSIYPKNKLSIGIPSYGYEATAGKRLLIRTYDQLKIKKGFATAKRDLRSGEMNWKTGKTVYFYQDRESIRQKVALVESLGINSISIWHLGGNQWF